MVDKVVIVTGASMGIGAATAKRFAGLGAKVVLAARKRDLLEVVATDIEARGGQALVVGCDMTDTAQIDNLVAETIVQFGRIDILVNNAGRGLNVAVKDMPINKLRDLFEVNLFGPLHAIRAVYPQMQKQGGGQIINVSSIIGYRSIPTISGYCMTKFALNALSEAARLELKSDNIDVLSVCPALTHTDFQKNTTMIGKRR